MTSEQAQALIARWRTFSRDSYREAATEMADHEGGNHHAAVRDQLAGDMWKQAADELEALLVPPPPEPAQRQRVTWYESRAHWETT